MNPPPPIPHDCGRATFRAKTVATAAAPACPPASSTPRPTRAAAGDSVATTPRRPVTPGRNSEPCFACAGTTATPARAIETTMTTRRTGGVLPDADHPVTLRVICPSDRAEGHGMVRWLDLAYAR